MTDMEAHTESTHHLSEFSYEQRVLPYIENPYAYHKYEVLKPIDNVTISQIAEAFEQPGGGMQYELPSIVNKLIKDKFLKEIK